MDHDLIEDDELLAPQGGSGSHSDDSHPDDVAGEWQPAHGYPDTRRAVRVWVDDETRRLRKVRLSTRWRDRLGTHRLEDAFSEAFFLANARVGDVPTLEQPGFAEVTAPASVAWESQEALTERISTLLERAAELSARPPEMVRWADYEGVKVSASSSYAHATVTLSLAGLTDSVVFDKVWLRTARMADIVDAVQQAHEKAYAKYQPPVFIPGEHEELALEIAEAQAALRVIVSKGL